MTDYTDDDTPAVNIVALKDKSSIDESIDILAASRDEIESPTGSSKDNKNVYRDVYKNIKDNEMENTEDNKNNNYNDKKNDKNDDKNDSKNDNIYNDKINDGTKNRNGNEIDKLNNAESNLMNLVHQVNQLGDMKGGQERGERDNELRKMEPLLVEKNQKEINDKDTLGIEIEKWISGRGMSDNLSKLLTQSTSDKTIIRLKRKRDEIIGFDEFYVPEKRRKIDALIDHMSSMSLNKQVKSALEKSATYTNNKDIKETSFKNTLTNDKVPHEQNNKDVNIEKDGQKHEEYREKQLEEKNQVQSIIDKSKYSFGKYRLLKAGVGLKMSTHTTQEEYKNAKVRNAIQTRKEKRLIKIQELRENNVKVIDIGYENDEMEAQDDVVYDIFVREGVTHEKPKNSAAPIIESFIHDDLLNEDDLSEEYDSEDSNAENNPKNDYGYVTDSDLNEEEFALPGEEYGEFSHKYTEENEEDDFEEMHDSDDDTYFSRNVSKSSRGVFNRYNDEYDSEDFGDKRRKSRFDHFDQIDESETDEEELIEFLDMLKKERNSMRD